MECHVLLASLGAVVVGRTGFFECGYCHATFGCATEEEEPVFYFFFHTVADCFIHHSSIITQHSTFITHLSTLIYQHSSINSQHSSLTDFLNR